MFEQREGKGWSARAHVLWAIVGSLVLGFIVGRFSAGSKPKFGWLNPDVLCVEIMWVILVAGALLSVWPRKPHQGEDSQSPSVPVR